MISELHAQDGYTALVAAAHYGHTRIVRALIEAGAEIDEGDGNSSTALNWAAYNGHRDVVELLLDAGADTSIPDGVRDPRPEWVWRWGQRDADLCFPRPPRPPHAFLPAPSRSTLHFRQQGRLPLYCARTQGHVKIAALLEAAIGGGAARQVRRMGTKRARTDPGPAGGR